MTTRSSQEPSVRNYLTDEGRPLEVGLQERTSNRLSAAVVKSHGRERERKRPGSDRVRYGYVCFVPSTQSANIIFFHDFYQTGQRAQRPELGCI